MCMRDSMTLRMQQYVDYVIIYGIVKEDLDKNHSLIGIYV